MKEQETKKKDEQQEAVADLAVTADQTEQVQGGGGTINAYGGFRGGVFVATGDTN
ncbi:MAG TPA: hypothetical protein VLE19_01425 [Pyrinomonadaceae bacterium]|nr:hypothetical protein [Pyrinomonadaceae bacterium]